MRTPRRRYVRRTPKIYGNLQPRARQWSPRSIVVILKKVLPFAVAAGLLYMLVAGPAFRVKHIEVRGASLIEPGAIQDSIPKGGSIWTIPKDRISSNLLQNPAVNQVRVLRGLPDTILIEVAERDARAFWVTGEKGSVLDSNGDSFLEYGLSNLPSTDTVIGKTLDELPHIIDRSGLGAMVGQQVASSLFLTFIGEVQAKMSEHLPEYRVTSYEVGATTYDVTMMTKPGVKVSL
ncbi:MAG TPA: FtsQ-type POTRA domain-containing protein, partial [Verrucomicrobiae bacterium]|nr:FtsQ-type POTRA domain-containing protein [Verrucomicrobiae bacterium]